MHVIIGDTQIYIHGKRKVILGPAGRELHTWPAGKNWKGVGILYVFQLLKQLRKSSLYEDYIGLACELVVLFMWTPPSVLFLVSPK